MAARHEGGRVWHQLEVLREMFKCRFHIMGGECNYLLRVSRGAERRLEFVPDVEWKSAAMMSWSEEAIQGMLTSAEAVLRDTASRLRLPVTVCLKASHVQMTPSAFGDSGQLEHVFARAGRTTTQVTIVATAVNCLCTCPDVPGILSRDKGKAGPLCGDSGGCCTLVPALCALSAGCAEGESGWRHPRGAHSV